MGIVGAVVTIVGGLLAASSFVVSKKPNAKELLEKLVPVQGWIGVVLFFWGIWGVIHFVMNLGLLKDHMVAMILFLAGSAVCLGVGFLLGYGLIAQYTLGKNEEAKAKAELVRAKLTTIQVPLGFAAVGLGIAALVMTFV